MYSFEWDKSTGGYRLKTQTGRFVASEIRPVFAEELAIIGLNSRLSYDPEERRPLLWAKHNTYWYRGEEIARLNKTQHGQPLRIEWKGSMFNDDETKPRRKKKLVPVNVETMVEKNRTIMSALIADTLKRIKEMYDEYLQICNAVYIGFSGGKDSMLLLDLCHRVLPLDVPIVFSDTDMELPDTYNVWDQIQERYEGRTFLKVSADTAALENWQLFGPPSQALRWCCSVHKSTPAILALKKRTAKKSIKTLAFIGVRGEESQRRSGYDDIGDGLKSHSQVNAMPILEWSAHELWLYTFERDLILNEAYRKGLPRVGCLICPLSTYRLNDLVRRNYPEEVAPFGKAVRDAIDREFSSEEDADAFVHSGGWYARKSGVSLKQVIEAPGVERKVDRVICEFPIEVEAALKEWLKTIGKIENAELTVSINEQSGKLECIWANGKADKTVSKWLAYTVHKAIACTGCNTCEAECPTGALSIKQDSRTGQTRVAIDETICIHCMRCYAPHDGCLRYYSKRYAGAKTMNISGINKYMTFGLKPEWIEVLGYEGADFRQTTALGNRMIPSAVTWFREAGLIADSTAIATTPLLEVGQKLGFNDLMFWQLLWLRLANISPLIKWYICNTDLDVGYATKQLDEHLKQSVASASVRKGALSSLNQLIKTSPIGTGGGALVDLELKGRSVVGLTRRSSFVDPLVVLYGLYVMAEAAGRATFTIRQMMTAEFEGEFVSPLSIFGIPPEEFKKLCLGLAALHSEFISCSFTLGLDEVMVFPEVKRRDDVMSLILQK